MDTNDRALASGMSGGEIAQYGQAGEMALVQREDTEIKAAMVLARQFPRNVSTAFQRVMMSVARPTFAKVAFYRFPRGKNTITGPSIGLMREAARCWGNVRQGVRLVAIDSNQVHLRAFAHDMETNTYSEVEDRFEKLIQRKDKYSGETRWVEPDERDLRELVSKRGAIALRGALSNVLPKDMIDEALATAIATEAKAGESDLTNDRERSIKGTLLAFAKIGVTGDDLEAYLKHPMQQLTGEELADLRAVYRSISEGEMRIADVFPPRGGAAAAAASASASGVDERMAQRTSARASKPSGEPKPAAASKGEPAEREQDQPTRSAKEEPAAATTTRGTSRSRAAQQKEVEPKQDDLWGDASPDEPFSPDADQP